MYNCAKLCVCFLLCDARHLSERVQAACLPCGPPQGRKIGQPLFGRIGNIYIYIYIYIQSLYIHISPASADKSEGKHIDSFFSRGVFPVSGCLDTWKMLLCVFEAFDVLKKYDIWDCLHFV